MNTDLAQYKLAHQLKDLDKAKAQGTSLISLYIAPGKQISHYQKLLTEEMGKTSCIKSKKVKNDVQETIKSIKHKLTLFKQVPENGLVIFCGVVEIDETRSKKQISVMEPIKPLESSFYHCDTHFHTEILHKQINNADPYGFIIVDGNGCLVGVLRGSDKTILHRYSVSLPRKHNKGGQSAPRFQRLWV